MGRDAVTVTIALFGFLCIGTGAWSGTGEWLSAGNCVVISPSTHRAALADTCHVLRVQSFHSAGVRDMAANLVESILASSTDVPTLWGGGCVLPCLAFAELGTLTNHEATFGGEAYYSVLREKLTNMANVVRSASSSGRPMLQAVVFLDADVQVFTGWFSEVVRMSGLVTMSAADVSSHQQLARVLAKVPDSALGLDTRPGHGVYFQRESRKKLNSGVIFAHAMNPSVLEGFFLANVSFMARDYGDQTALQRAVNKVRRKNTACHDRPDALCGLSVGMFNKSKVNAAVVDFQRATVLIHHAHMSGRYKRQALRLTLQSKGNRTASVHSGRFLGGTLALPGCTPLRVEFSDAVGGAEHAVAAILKSRACPAASPDSPPMSSLPIESMFTVSEVRVGATSQVSHPPELHVADHVKEADEKFSVRWALLACAPILVLMLKRLCHVRRS